MKRIILLLWIILFISACQKDYEQILVEPANSTFLKSVEIGNDADYTVYIEMNQFIRQKGKPVIEPLQIGSPDLNDWEECFNMYVKNGDETGNFVSSAVVKVDGEIVLGPSDFKNKESLHSIELCSLTEQSILEVELMGKPASVLEIWIEGIIKDPFAGDEGTFIDERDGQEYKWVRICDQIWMAENLAYLPAVSPPNISSSSNPLYYVYGYYGFDVSTAKATVNYSNYGVLYNWVAAMDGAASSSANPSGVQGLSPEGWHIPSDDECIQMEICIGMNEDDANDILWRGTDEGTKLKATSGWNNNGNGTDDYGFSALPSGIRDYNSQFNYVGIDYNWWSSTRTGHGDDAWFRKLNYLSTNICRGGGHDYFGRSVRCVKD